MRNNELTKNRKHYVRVTRKRAHATKRPWHCVTKVQIFAMRAYPIRQHAFVSLFRLQFIFHRVRAAQTSLGSEYLQLSDDGRHFSVIQS